LKKIVIFVVILLVAINVLIELLHEPDLVGEEFTEILTSCEEVSTSDSIATAQHWRTWQEYGLNEIYCANYAIGNEQANAARDWRNTMSVNNNLSTFEIWHDVYLQLYIDAKDHLNHVQDSLRAAAKGHELDRDAFARMVVAFVQDIPYQYVVSEGCEDKAGLCNPNVRYGIYAPLEFLYSLKGDCDTRTVLLYTLLRNFGYEPLIINSMEYRHSMLALDLPFAGDDFLYRGRRYAYWETTNVGWLPGMLPPEMNNENYWQVALDYEYKDFPARTY
jgi:hypothetical protein